MTPDELTADVLGILRREFFKPGDSREFFQQRDILRQAITAPAADSSHESQKAPERRADSVLSLSPSLERPNSR